MRKTPLALNTSDFWKLNDLIDALYVIVDCHLRAKKSQALIADIETWLRAQNYSGRGECAVNHAPDPCNRI